MTNKLKNLVPAVLFVFAIMALSSCNRGMGCPNNFSVEKATTDVPVQAPDMTEAVACK